MGPWEGCDASCLAASKRTTEKSESKAGFEPMTSVTHEKKFPISAQPCNILYLLLARVVHVALL